MGGCSASESTAVSMAETYDCEVLNPATCLANDPNKYHQGYEYWPDSGSYCSWYTIDPGGTFPHQRICVNASCVPFADCSATAGLRIASGWASAAAFCDGSCTWQPVSGGLAYSASGSSFGTQVYEQVDQNCSVTDTPAAAADPDGCVTMNGVTACHTEEDTNCGTVNGVPVCVDALPPGDCFSMGSEGYVCASTAGTPPAPDNGTPGQPAEADLILTDLQSGSVFNYYNSTTSSNSSTTVTTGTGTGGPDSTGSYDSQMNASLNAIEDALTDQAPAPSSLVPPEFQGGVLDPDQVVDWGQGTDVVDTGSGFLTTVSGLFPFSLLASPIVAFSSSTDAPSFSVAPNSSNGSYTMDLSPWAPLFSYVRYGIGILLIFGFIMTMLETIKRWTTS